MPPKKQTARTPRKGKERRDIPRSFRLDPETDALIGRLALAMRDSESGKKRTATDVIRIAVRELAVSRLPEKT